MVSMSFSRRFAAKKVFAAVFVAIPSLAHAHGFAQPYTLPVPLWLYLTGAAAAVGLSFVVVAIFARRGGATQENQGIDLLAWAPTRALAAPPVFFALRAAGVIVFLFIVAAGLFGAQDTFKNIAPVFVWVIWWVGMAYVSALFGNVWALVNPWSAIFRAAEALWRLATGGREFARARAAPTWLGAWPAAFLFLCFAWTEMAWPEASHPRNLAFAILAYSVIAWAGMWLYGRATWLRQGEAFAVAFGLIARFGPFFGTAEGTTRAFRLRPFATGLLVREPVHPSIMAFAVLMLSSVTFDGFRETPLWFEMSAWALRNSPFFEILAVIDEAGGDVDVAITSAGLLVFPLVFFAVYFVCCALMARCAGGGESAMVTARRFVLTLVPIAIAYHLAHYLAFLLTAGQYMIPLSSDPFGLGWDLFDTQNYFVSPTIVDARFVWITSVAAIVIGHIAAVWLAHLEAVRSFTDARKALRSQYPMLVLMLSYTAISLWILAQPVVKSG